MKYLFSSILISCFMLVGSQALSENQRLANQSRAMIGKKDASSKKINTLKSWDAVKYIAKQANIISQQESNALSSQKMINVKDEKVKRITSIPVGYIIGFYDKTRLVHVMISTGNGKAVGVNNKTGIGVGTNKILEEISLQQLKLTNSTFKRGVKIITMVQKPGEKIRDINYYQKVNKSSLKRANTVKTSNSNYGSGLPKRGNDNSGYSKAPPPKQDSRNVKDTNGYSKAPPPASYDETNNRAENANYGKVKNNAKPTNNEYGTVKNNKTGKYPVPPPPKQDSRNVKDADGYSKAPPPASYDETNKRAENANYQSIKNNKSSDGYTTVASLTSADLYKDYTLLGQYKVTDWGKNSNLPPARIVSLAFRNAKDGFERGINIKQYIAVAYKFILDAPDDTLEKKIDDITAIKYHKASNLLLVYDTETRKPLELYRPKNGIAEFNSRK